MARGLTPGVTAGATSARSAGADAIGEEAHEEGGREPDDVQVVAVDAGDEGGAATLHGVGARAALPFPRGHVPVDVGRRERTELDERDDPVELFPALAPQTEPRDDLVLAPRERREYLRRFRRRSCLSEPAPVQEHVRVHAEHDATVAVDRPRLPRRVLDRVVADLLVPGRDDDERDPELLQDRATLRRRRRED